MDGRVLQAFSHLRAAGGLRRSIQSIFQVRDSFNSVSPLVVNADYANSKGYLSVSTLHPGDPQSRVE